MAAAERADRQLAAGRDNGPLHGIPIAVKDNCYSKGILTEVGSKVLAGFVPSVDATVLQKLYAAGAVLIGKTRCHEFSCGGSEPPTRGPWDSEPISWRQQHRIRCGAGGALGLRRHRHGYRRFRPHSGVDQQFGRHESDLWARERLRRGAAGLVA